MDESKRADPVRDYLEYLERMRRKHNIGMWQIHQLALSRAVARDYGLTEDQIEQLDEDL